MNADTSTISNAVSTIRAGSTAVIANTTGIVRRMDYDADGRDTTVETSGNRVTIVVQVGDSEDNSAVVEISGYDRGATAIVALARCADEDVIEDVVAAMIADGQTTEEEINRELELAGDVEY